MTYWSTEPSNSIPASQRREASGVTTDGTSRQDISEGRVALRVEPRVQESKHGLAGGEERVVDKSDDSGCGGCRGTGSVEEHVLAIIGDDVAVALRGDIGIGASGLVVETGKLVADFGQVVGHDGILVCRAGEVVAETTATCIAVLRIVGDDFGVDVLGASDRGHVWAAVGKTGEECARVLAVVAEASSVGTHTIVSGREEQRHTTSAELGE